MFYGDLQWRDHQISASSKGAKTMKQLTSEEYKNLLLEIMLKIDRICRDNDIRYTWILP